MRCLRRRGRAFRDRRDHRHADAGDDARRADRSGADADLDGVDADRDQSLGGFRRRDVARDQVEVGERLAQLPDDVHHALRVAVRGIDDENVDVRVDQRRRAIERIARDADGRAAAQPSQRILAGVRILDRLLDVLDGDQALQLEVLVDHEKLFDLRLVQNLARLVERGADRHGDQPLLRHHFGDRARSVGLESQVAIGQDADQPSLLAAAFGDRHARDAVPLHQLERFADQRGRRDRDRVDDHAALGSLHAIDFERLIFDRQVLVDDAHAALLRHGDGHLRLGDGVHRRAQERHVQFDVLGEARADVDLCRQHGGVPRHEQDVVKGERGAQTGLQ